VSPERPIDPELRAILCCPACRGPLADVPGGLVCPAEGRFYPVEGGVPFLVEECARPATEAERAAAR
jgi:uncharacterized protein YbaR (Trm112 family)